jgi:two-component system LytT family response regulator
MIVDDEPTARRRLARLLGDIVGVTIVAECASGREALRSAELERPDVVFLDIAMPGLDGLDVARRLGASGGPLVVFVTAFDEHALAAFRVHAADYVLKPLDRERLRETVEHVRRAIAGGRGVAAERAIGPRLAIRDGRSGHFVSIADVLWVESFGNYTRIYTTHARYIHRATMAKMAEQLAPFGFTRVHRTTIVNVARVVRLRPAGSGEYEASLDTGVRLRVSRTYRNALDPLWQDPGLNGRETDGTSTD